jgi:hypothetical protein
MRPARTVDVQLFELFRHAGGEAIRLVDAVTCRGCGSVLMRSRLELACDPRAEANRIVCVTCDAMGALIAGSVRSAARRV